ncbi:MAG: class I SAM-dependent methyltransferase [Candidatus Tectomicrobia bacterium]|uniref:Class I SAM-dependent methyltransferase n=1 Tax=Tectimicrobiota bacterium TaxID=2528274 RepID=A0A932CMG1_UNCTE|nr:class I SAM-dependent methyltransferase [Candidatus Tectomicrobia bacterium]
MRKILKYGYIKLDRLYLRLDKELLRRTRNLRWIPKFHDRRGGKVSYGEWCHVVGIFQTLLYIHLNQKANNHILDIGCGTGLLAIASEPFIGDSGKYIGIDVSKEDISFCKKHYLEDNFSFIHLNVYNQTYASKQNTNKMKWDISNESMDMVAALSVFTHFNEDDAIFYFREIDRVLKPGGKAIITFFLLNDTYYQTLQNKSNTRSKYHNTRQDAWIFDQPCSKSNHWLHPQWVKQPEDAIGVAPVGIESLQQGTRLFLTETYEGNWKEVPGIFFQDILVFQKR